MPRMNDRSPYPREWTTAKLFRELNSYANLESFSWEHNATWGGSRPRDADDVREVTLVYRQSWLQPIINELARRAKVEL